MVERRHLKGRGLCVITAAMGVRGRERIETRGTATRSLSKRSPQRGELERPLVALPYNVKQGRPGHGSGIAGGVVEELDPVLAALITLENRWECAGGPETSAHGHEADVGAHACRLLQAPAESESSVGSAGGIGPKELPRELREIAESPGRFERADPDADDADLGETTEKTSPPQTFLVRVLTIGAVRVK